MGRKKGQDFYDLLEEEQRTALLEQDRTLASAKVKDIGTPALGGGLEDADHDTKVEVEQAADEDKVRMTTAGVQRAVLDNSALDLTVPVNTNTINEHSANTGVTIDTVLIKDGAVDGVDVSGLDSAVVKKVHFDATTFLYATNDNTPEAKTPAQVRAVLNVADGADVTADNAPQAHAASHQNAGDDEISVAGLSGLLADDQHVLDAEVLSAVEGEATLDLTGDVTIAAAKSLAVDTISEKTGAAGVTIDGVTLKDDAVESDAIRGLKETGGQVMAMGAVGDGEYLKRDGTDIVGDTPGGAGDVTAAANMTDNTIIKGDGGGKGVQDSGITIDDSDNVSGMGTLGCGAITSTGDIDSAGALKGDTISEHTAATGVTIDSALVKDGAFHPLAKANVKLASDAGENLYLWADLADLDGLFYTCGNNTWSFMIAGATKAKVDATGLKADVIDEINADAGVTIDTVPIKDGLVDGLDCSGVEAGADVTDAENVNAAGAVMESDFDATTFLYATDDNTPQPKTPAEVKAILDLEIGTDVLAQQTIGIADDNLMEVDDADAAANDIAQFTANGLQGLSYAELLAALSGQAGADFAMNTHKITGVVDPAADQDAATKKYVDDNIGGASTFLDLTDTPADYTDQGGKVVAVNVGEDALEFIAAGGGGAVDIQEGGGSVVGAATAINFAAADFIITDEGGNVAGVAIDYANSKIARKDQTESITGAWTFQNDLAINPGTLSVQKINESPVYQANIVNYFSGGIGTAVGVGGQDILYGTTAYERKAKGLYFRVVDMQQGGGGTISEFYSAQLVFQFATADTHTIDEMAALYADIFGTPSLANVTITAAYGIKLTDLSLSQMTTYTAIDIPNSSNAGTNYLMRLGPATPYFQVDGGAAPGASATKCHINVNGSLLAITAGAADSGGTDYRCLRVPN